MKTLVIDNIDSFVYNIVQYVGILGGNPLVLQNTASEEDIDRAVAGGIERIIISPGPKAPKDAKISNYVIRRYGPETPTLGVCLGHQCIGYVYGGRIVHAKELMHGKTSEIEHDGSGVLKGLPNPFQGGRYHSLAVSEDGLPKELRVTARSGDGEVMGLQHVDYPIYGVQFHPESVLTPDGMRIIKNFVGGKA
jgi:anthranilate synthase component II